MVYDLFNNKRKKIAVLIDPDKYSSETKLKLVMDNSIEAGVDMFFVGGSLISEDINNVILRLKKYAKQIPVVIFPGNVNQLSHNADALLFLSLISGRNPEYLIGQHVVAAPFIRKTSLEVIPTGYILIEGGATTSVEYISNTKPIPASKHEIVVATALAGYYLGMKAIYLETGSAAANSVDENLIKKVKENIDIPIIVGGGIKSVEKIHSIFSAGADIVVLGTIVEENPDFLIRIKSQYY